MEPLILTVFYLIQIFQWIIIGYAILSWFIPPTDPIRQFLARIVEPIAAPIRQIMPPIGGIDLSLIVLYFLIEILKRFLLQIL